MCGTLGCAPAAAGLHSIVPPRRVGGNMDIRDIAAGTTLYLPVEVAGALFSVLEADGQISILKREPRDKREPAPATQ